MIIPAGFYKRDAELIASLFPPAVLKTLDPETIDALHMTNPLPLASISFAFGDSPSCGQFVIVSRPGHWYAECGIETKPNPLSAVALVTKVKHYIVEDETAALAVVRQHGLSVQEWPVQDEDRSDPIAA